MELPDACHGRVLVKWTKSMLFSSLLQVKKHWKYHWFGDFTENPARWVFGSLVSGSWYIIDGPSGSRLEMTLQFCWPHYVLYHSFYCYHCLYALARLYGWPLEVAEQKFKVKVGIEFYTAKTTSGRPLSLLSIAFKTHLQFFWAYLSE